MVQDKILVLDFGGQYTQLIAKTVRKEKVFSEIVDCNHNIGDIIRNPPKGIILSGGPDSVYEKGAPYINEYLLELGIPILGLCYGMQLINFLSKGKILHGDVVKEYGATEVLVENTHALFNGLEKKIIGWMSHGDSIDGKNMADGFKIVANTKDHVAAFANDERKIYGLQFHPEVTHTPDGSKIISNFLDICNCKRDWTTKNYIQQSKEYVRKTIGNDDVICFVSGGVDSAFVAALLAQTKGIGRLHCIYVNALMRKNESEEVIASLRGAGVKDLIVVDAEERFIDVLKGMSDPEKKRKAIGNLFGLIQEEECEKLGLDPNKTFVAMGTLYTDKIESGKGVGNKAANIKSHHNVGCPYIDDLVAKGLVVEPNKWIFKDEVREAAFGIGLPKSISQRQPYPGPGLGIRIVDALPEWIDSKYYEIDAAVKRIAKEGSLEGYLLPVKSVGVQGDGRTYKFAALLRGERDWTKIRDAAKKLTDKTQDINRVVYDVGQGHLKRECIDKIIQTQVCRETVDLLKEVDYESRRIIDKYDFTDKISQTIFVLFGADIYETGKRSIAQRAVSTDNFMTVSPIAPIGEKMSWECLDEIHRMILANYNVGAFVIDVTDKPPATTCWE